MRIDLAKIAQQVSLSTGLVFEPHKDSKVINSRQMLRPAMHDPSSTFLLEVEFGWRHLVVRFVPGAFSADLLEVMSKAAEADKNLFAEMLQHANQQGAVSRISLGGAQFNSAQDLPWHSAWKNFVMELKIGQLALDEGNIDEIAAKWLNKLVGIMLCIIPIDQSASDIAGDEVEGYNEGAVQKIFVNRYERDPRNRTIALAYHGSSCSACGVSLGQVYGDLATDLIEFHHVIPLSEIGHEYALNPKEDLVPLCPNCHAVAHRRSPPLSPSEISELLSRTSDHDAE